MATVPTGLQTCAKILQMHLSGGGGTPWMQPKVIENLKVIRFWLLVLDLKFIMATVANLCKNPANAPFRGWGDTLLIVLASPELVKVLAAGFGFKYFHYNGHCAHRVANLCKNTANAPFRGWGDTLDATQK